MYNKLSNITFINSSQIKYRPLELGTQAELKCD
jgi:hypothetical protein